MKETFRPRLINDPFGDPCLYIRMTREKKAILFDLGDIRSLSSAELHTVTDVFVTHTHIDHFIGFDALLRIILRREIPLNIYGPSGITGNVQGKLRGYTWNLIRDYPARINVFGVGSRTVTHTLFSAADGFRKRIIDKRPAGGLLLDARLFTVSAAGLSHGTSCLAYRLEGKPQINIDKDRLLKKGLTVGPWLTEFKNRLHEQGPKGTIFIDGKRYRIRELMDIVRTDSGPIISYATDIAINRKNLHALIAFVEGSDILYCEAYFLEKDRQRAVERSHLTAAECGRIAKAAKVKKLALMHFSPRYKDSPQLLIEEATREFEGEVICKPFQQFRQSARQAHSF
ncbi:MAG: ribonuclease Z [Nitrospirae bacterium]|nr:ribonuclease Z [Nitrospirota bacterium]